MTHDQPARTRLKPLPFRILLRAIFTFLYRRDSDSTLTLIICLAPHMTYKDMREAAAYLDEFRKSGL